jgi:hypothetical protein
MFESGQIWQDNRIDEFNSTCSHKRVNIVSFTLHNNVVSSTCDTCKQWLLHEAKFFVKTFSLIGVSRYASPKVCKCDIQALMINGCHCGNIKRYNEKSSS